MKPKKKQYIIESAYTGSYHIITIVDGRIETSTIVTDYNLDGYISQLEGEGYSKGYYLPIYKQAYKEAEKALKNAEQDLDTARQYSIRVDTDEEPRLRKILLGYEYIWECE